MYGKIESNRSLKFGSVLVILAIIASAMAVLFVLDAETSVSSAEIEETQEPLDNRPLQGNAGEKTIFPVDNTDESQEDQALPDGLDEIMGEIRWEIGNNTL